MTPSPSEPNIEANTINNKLRQDTPMDVQNERDYVDEEGNVVYEVSLGGSRYDTITATRTDDQLLIEAKHVGTDDIDEFSLSLTDELYKGVAHESRTRRTFEDDLQDILQYMGFTLTNNSIASV